MKDGSREAEERDGESEEEVCDFGVGVGAWGWGGCQLVLFPVDKTLRSLSLCRSLSLSYSAILSPLPPLLHPNPPPCTSLFLCYFPPRCASEKRKRLDKFKGKKNKEEQWWKKHLDTLIKKKNIEYFLKETLTLTGKTA